MKRFVLILTLSFSYILASAQCTPNPLYQDSTYNIWPDTIVNLPYCQQGVPYSAVLDIKTPTTLIEASAGDSALTSIDTLGQTFYVGGWPVDSMVLVQAVGIPTGLSLGCNEPNCVLQGNVLTCAFLQGTTNDPPGIYPIEIIVNVYTHGDITYYVGPIPITVPVETDLYSATGSYESVTGYEIVVGLTGEVELQGIKELTLHQNSPNPFSAYTTIQFNTLKVDEIAFEVVDMFGRKVFADNIISSKGVNTYKFKHDLSAGIYMYSINNGKQMITKRMIVAEK